MTQTSRSSKPSVQLFQWSLKNGTLEARVREVFVGQVEGSIEITSRTTRSIYKVTTIFGDLNTSAKSNDEAMGLLENMVRSRIMYLFASIENYDREQFST